MKRLKIFALLFVVLAPGFAGMQLSFAADARRIPARQIADRPEFIILDVRTEEEFKARHVKGAVLIPHDEIRARAAALPKDKNKRVLVYCRRGIRSRKAAEELNGMGYANVYDLGGREQWSREAAIFR